MNQVIIPRQIFIGDTAELRFSFICTDARINEYAKENLRNFQHLSSSAFVKPDSTTFSIKDIRIIQNSDNYFTMNIIFVPWKTGDLKLSEYDLTAAIFGEEINSKSAGEDYLVDFEPINVLSIIEQNNLTEEIGSPQYPKLLPGTIYAVYFRLILLLVFLIAGIILLIQHKKVSFWIKNAKLKAKYRKNKNKTIKTIEKALVEFENNIIDDKKLSELIQQHMRKYLEVRFAYPFINATSSEIVKKYYDITLGLLSDKKNEAIEDIAAVFIRTDYIRYASERTENAKYLLNEAGELIQRLKTAICTIETEDNNADISNSDDSNFDVGTGEEKDD